MASSTLIDDVITRTEEGASALLRAVTAAASNPARAGYLAAAATAVGAEFLGASKTAQVASTALLPLLALSGQDRTPTNLLSSVAGAIGQWEKHRSPHKPSASGVVGTIAPHVNYIAALRRRKATASPVVAAGYAGVWAAGSALAATTSTPHLPAVATGGAVVATMAALAQDPRLRDNIFTQGVSHGGNLLLASESITFAKNLLPAKQTLARRLAGAAEAGLFAVGHLLMLVDSQS